MLSYQNNVVKTSVRKLVEFFLRSGDIETGTGLVSDPEAMLEGSRLHRKIQRSKKAGYRSEVPLKMSWHRAGYELVLEGRADGIDMAEYRTGDTAGADMENKRGMDAENDSACMDAEGGGNPEISADAEEDSVRKIPLIDEIKCVYKDVRQIEEAETLHLAQAKCYAYMYAGPAGYKDVLVQITYCNMETEELQYITRHYEIDELEQWFGALMDQYALWADRYVEARRQRNESIETLEFPFDYRPGQKKLAAMVYRSISEKKSIFLQAPTGVGKTISTLYPALKCLGEEKAERVFYLTAKTITRTVAEQTLRLLKEQGLRLKAVSLTAKERICDNEVMECHPAACEKARGHFDRINGALYALLTEKDVIRREDILEYSERYQVCPYELSFEAAQWADSVICDYNYVFDPHVNRKSLFSEQSGSILLIDEAHNLLDRARDMYSAVLRKEDFVKMKKIFREKQKGIVRKLQSCNSELLRMSKQKEEIADHIDKLYYPLFWLLGTLEDYLKDHPEFEYREEVVEFYFQARHFFMILDTMEDGYEIYGEGEGTHLKVHLFCVDPSSRLAGYLEKCRAGIFFSATLLPIQYYRQLLGGNSSMEAFSVSSPFEKEKRLLAIASDVTSRYSRRGADQYQKMVRYLEETISVRPGNYMIFFPSYDMLSQVCALAEESTLALAADFLVQSSSMSEKEREEFLDAFQEENSRSLIGFCVLGSIFSEGIDLTGRRLIGVMVVGTGIPQICEERERIRTYFDRRGKKGYDYAYRYPGMNKVLQAAGRVIRTAGDTGTILLMDDRFLLRENQLLLPEEWDSYYEVNLHNYKTVLGHFWENVPEKF